MNTTGTGTGVFGGTRRAGQFITPALNDTTCLIGCLGLTDANAAVGAGPGMTAGTGGVGTGGVGTGAGIGTHRGPVRAAENAMMGGTTGAAGGVPAAGGAGATTVGTTGMGTGATTGAAGTARPSAAQRIVGELPYVGVC